MMLETILYIIQVVSLVVALACTIVMYKRMIKALNYMVEYCNNRGGSKNNVTKEFAKVIKMLGGK